MCAVGRGAIVIKGSKFSATCDMPKEPVQIFTVGNIIAGTFKETFMGTADRANAVEVTYTDKDKAWERTTLPVYATDWDDAGINQNPTQIKMDAIIKQEQAYQQAKYYLRRNALIKRNVEFEADIDAIACETGDAIMIQHDLPQWGYGGRILEVIEADTLRLDRAVTFTPGKTYQILIRHSETDVVTTYVVDHVEDDDGPATTGDIIVLSTSPYPTPIPYNDVYAYGETGIETKPFVVTAITKTKDMRCQITAEEYNAAIYTDADPGEETEYSELRQSVDVINLAATQNVIINLNGAATINISASWELPPSEGEVITKYHIYYAIDDGTVFYKYGETFNQTITLTGLPPQNYYIKY
jgi:predicted phage tail protein